MILRTRPTVALTRPITNAAISAEPKVSTSMRAEVGHHDQGYPAQNPMNEPAAHSSDHNGNTVRRGAPSDG